MYFIQLNIHLKNKLYIYKLHKRKKNINAICKLSLVFIKLEIYKFHIYLLQTKYTPSVYLYRMIITTEKLY